MDAAKVVIDKSYSISKIDKRLYGSFVEHLGRCVYGGIFEPGHPLSDEDGFRNDVLGLVRELKIPIVRYPGGNFVSQYDWEDGVGPVEMRPKRLDLAWNTIETNKFGVNEFVKWARKAEAEVMMAVNLGTRGPKDAANLVEYCNYPGGTRYSDLRAAHGFAQPHKIKTWCLGNEMDGEWQIGEKTPFEYGRVAYEASKQMKLADPMIETVACGSSSHYMKSFPEWDARVLEHCYSNVDYLSLHIYYDVMEGNVGDFYASGMEMDNYIKTAASVCDYVQATKKSKKKMMLSFDEWNVWFLWRGEKENPDNKNLLYTFGDALVFGTLLNALIRNADRVKIGCQAQLVNLLAPIYTEKGGAAFRQTIFYPYLYASLYGQGESLLASIDSPKYDGETISDIPFLDLSATRDADKNEAAVFMVNRSREEELPVEIDLRSFGEIKILEHACMYSDDLTTRNRNAIHTVAPFAFGGSRVEGGIFRAALPKHSWHCVRFKTSE